MVSSFGGWISIYYVRWKGPARLKVTTEAVMNRSGQESGAIPPYPAFYSEIHPPVEQTLVQLQSTGPKNAPFFLWFH